MQKERCTRRDFLKLTITGSLAALGLSALAEDGQQRARSTSAAAAAEEIPRRKLGDTDIKVSILGFGSHVTAEHMRKPKEREKQLRQALEEGVNLFDVYCDPKRSTYRSGTEAPSYDLTARVLREAPQEALVSIMMPPSLKELDEVLRTFGREAIDLVRVYVGGTPRAEKLRLCELMAEAKEAGKVRAIGIAAHSQDELVEGFERQQLDFAPAIYNFHERWGDYQGLAPLLKRRRASLIAMKPLGRGSLVKFAQKLRAGEEEDGLSVPAAALRFIYRNPMFASAIPSMYSMAEVTENLAAGHRPRLSRAEHLLLERISRAAGADRCRSMKFSLT